MALRTAFYTLSVITVGALFGCSDSGSSTTSARSPQPTAEEIAANVDKLDEADRALAKSQKFCAVQTEHPLGSMGVPVKVMVNDEPVFLCCSHCEANALRDPTATLAAVAKLRGAVAAP